MERAAPLPAGPGKRLIGDERLRVELELCDRWGIPHSLFRGAGDGTWSERDRDKALAYRDYQRTVCPHCGTRYDDWDHGGDDEEDQFVATLQRCVGCQVIADKQAELEKDSSAEDARGMKVALVPVSVQAAVVAERELTRPRRRRDDNDD